MKIHILQRVRAFTLVEVVIAIGIISVALIAIIGLLPVGMTSVRESRSHDVATEILAAVAADMRKAETDQTSSPLFNLPVFAEPPAAQTRHFDRYGQLLSAPENAFYLLDATPRTTPAPGIIAWHLAVSWPPQNPSLGGSVETIFIRHR